MKYLVVALLLLLAGAIGLFYRFGPMRDWTMTLFTTVTISILLALAGYIVFIYRGPEVRVGLLPLFCDVAILCCLFPIGLSSCGLFINDIQSRFATAKYIRLDVSEDRQSAPGATAYLQYEHPVTKQIHESTFNPISVSGLNVGDEVRIRYEPANPYEFRVMGERGDYPREHYKVIFIFGSILLGLVFIRALSTGNLRALIGY